MKKIIYILLIFQCSLIIGNAQWIPDLQWSGLGTFQFDTIGNSIYCAVYYGGILRSTNLGLNWSTISGSQIPSTAYNVVHNSNYLFAGLYENGVYRTSNNGLNWTEVNNGLPIQIFRDIRALIARGSSVYAGGTLPSGYIYKTINNGDSWFVPDTSSHIMNVHSFANLGQYLFIGATWGIFRTSNEGLNWVHLSSGLDSVYYANVFVSGNKIFAAGSNDFGTQGLYVSDDFGNNWVNLLSGVNTVSVYNNTIFGGFGNDFYVSSNNGVNWVNKNEGLNKIILSIFALNGRVFLGTGNGYPEIPVLWSRSINELVNVNTISSKIPKEYSLEQNYPNPFNPSTNIRYEILKNGFVKLVVFDILGHEIQTLVNEKQNAGTYEVTFNARQPGLGSNLSSGIYFYTLISGDFKETKKFVLLK